MHINKNFYIIPLLNRSGPEEMNFSSLSVVDFLTIKLVELVEFEPTAFCPPVINVVCEFSVRSSRSYVLGERTQGVRLKCHRSLICG